MEKHQMAKTNLWICLLSILIQIIQNIYILIILHTSLIKRKKTHKCCITIYVYTVIVDLSLYVIFYPQISVLYILTFQVIFAIGIIRLIEVNDKIINNDENENDSNLEQIQFAYNPEFIYNHDDDNYSSYESQSDNEIKKLFDKCSDGEFNDLNYFSLINKNCLIENYIDESFIHGDISSNPYATNDHNIC